MLAFLRKLTDSPDLSTLLQQALEGVLLLVPQVGSGSAMLLQDGRYEYVAAKGHSLEGLKSIYFDLGAMLQWYGGSFEQALSSQPLVHAHEQRHSQLPSELQTTLQGLRWVVSIPVAVDGEVLVWFNLERYQDSPFSADTLDLLSELSLNLAVVLRSQRDRQRLAARLRQEERLSRILGMLSAYRTAETLWQTLPQLLADMLAGFKVFALRLQNDQLLAVGNPQQSFNWDQAWQAMGNKRLRTLALTGGGTEVYVPMLDFQGQPLGALALVGPVAFNPQDRPLLETVAQGVGHAISRLEAQSRQQKELDRLQALAQAGQVLVPAYSVKEVYQRVVEEVMRGTRAASALVSRYLPEEDVLEVEAASGYAAEQAIGRRFSRGQAVGWRVVEAGKPLFIPDVAHLDLAQFASGTRSGGAYLGVPLTDPEGQCIGVLSADTAGAGGEIGIQDSYILEAIAQVAGITVARLQALEEARQIAEHNRALVQMSSDLELLTEPLEIARRALETLLPLSGFQVGGMFRLQQDTLAPAVVVGQLPTDQAEAFRQVPNLIKERFLNPMPLPGQTLVVPDLHNLPTSQPGHLHGGLRTLMLTQLHQQGKVVGWLVLASFGEVRQVQAESRSLFGATARRVERALERVAHLEEITYTREAALRSLGLGLELRDLETKGHTDRVVKLTELLGQRLNFPDPEGLRLGAYLHDLGKLAVPDSILHKPGPLSTSERRTIMFHPEVAFEMLQGLSFLPQTTLNVVRYHHEHWDGSGYPLGLSGEEIPLEARIFSVVDVYDALAYARPYKPAWQQSQVYAELTRLAGETLDPKVVAVALEVLKLQP